MLAITGKLLGQTFLPYFYAFLAGGLLMEYFDRVIGILKKYWFLFVMWVHGFIDLDIASYGIIYTALLICSMIGLAYRIPYLKFPVGLSYGLYIYHMAIINAMIEMGFTGETIYVIIALTISLIWAAISYFTVGAWGHGIKKKAVSSVLESG